MWSLEPREGERGIIDWVKIGVFRNSGKGYIVGIDRLG